MTAKSDIDHWQIVAKVFDDRVEEIHFITNVRQNIRRQQLTKVWHREKVLGAGGYGQVRLEINRDEQTLRAVKRIATSEELSHSDCQKELKALLEFSKPKYKEAAVFIEFLGWFHHDSCLHLAMEYAEHGDLEANLAKHGGRVSETESRDITQQILQGLLIMHAESFAHRDLKPQNVMVMNGPPQWWVKLADFGLSKKPTEDSAFRTQAGTPSYMAPEVHGYVDAESESYTNAVDLWATGCIIYRMVTGNTPFPKCMDLNNFCNGKSAFPSQNLQMYEVGQICINLVEALLAPAPQKRPSAAQALENSWFNSNPTFDGIVRRLSSLNPRANENSNTSLSTIDYRTETHKALGSSSIVDKSSISPPPTGSAQATENTSQVDESNPEQGELKRAESIVQTRLRSLKSVENTFHSQQPYKAAKTTHRTALPSQQHLSREETMNSLISVTDLEAARRDQEQTLALQQRVLGEEHPDTLNSMHSLGTTLYNQQQYKAAEEIYRKTLALQQRILGEEHPDTLASMHNLGTTLYSQQQYKAAEEIHRKTLALRQRILGEEHPDILASMNNLGAALSGQQQYKAAEEIYLETLALRLRILGEEHPDTLVSMSNLGNILFSQQQYKAAEEMFCKTFALQQYILGEEHPDTLINRSNLGNALYKQQEYKAAEEIHRKTLALQQRVLGEEHPDTLNSMRYLGFALYKQHEYKAAEELYQNARIIRKRVFGEEHLDTLTSMRSVVLMDSLLEAILHWWKR